MPSRAVPTPQGKPAKTRFQPVSKPGAVRSARTQATSDQDLSDGIGPAEGPGVGEHFIPISRFEILDRMTRAELWPGGEAAVAKRFYRYLSAWRHILYQERMSRLEETYLPFSPETDLVRIGQYSPEQRVSMRREFVSLMRKLLLQANYSEITLEQLQAELNRKKSDYDLDLKVDLDEFEDCIVYRRGVSTQSRKKKDWKKAYLKNVEIEYPAYQRLFVLLKLKPEDQRIREIAAAEQIEPRQAEKIMRKGRKMLPDAVTSEHVYIKLFKDIPLSEVEMMFPNTRVKFRTIDKLKLGVTAGSGVVGGIIAAAAKLTLFLVNPIAAGLAAVGLGGILFRQVSNVMTQHSQYMLVLAQSLYFHSLADNRGVIALLANRAEEEDIKEEMLLYCVLAKERVRVEELTDVKAAIEQFLVSEFAVKVDFDIHDALSRLKQDGIVTVDANGLVSALPPMDGCRHLDGLWDNYLVPDGVDRELMTGEAAV